MSELFDAVENDDIDRVRQLLDSGFWYKANTASNVIFTGYFALRRQ